MFRDKGFIGILGEMIRERQFLDDCLDDCPILLACILYASYKGWSPPSNLDTRLSITTDVYGGIERVFSLTLQARDPRDYIKGPGIDSSLNETVRLTKEELIRRADPAHPNSVERLAAAFVLEYTVADSEHLSSDLSSQESWGFGEVGAINPTCLFSQSWGERSWHSSFS